MKDSDFWKKFDSIPKSLIRVCMFITQNGNRVEKRFLASELVRLGIVSSASCNQILYRGIEVHHILKETDGYVSVAKPVPFILKPVRASLLDNWKAFVFVTLALTIISAIFFSFIITVFFGVVSLIIVVGWFLEDYVNIKKF